MKNTAKQKQKSSKKRWYTFSIGTIAIRVVYHSHIYWYKCICFYSLSFSPTHSMWNVVLSWSPLATKYISVCPQHECVNIVMNGWLLFLCDIDFALVHQSSWIQYWRSKEIRHFIGILDKGIEISKSNILD